MLTHYRSWIKSLFLFAALFGFLSAPATQAQNPVRALHNSDVSLGAFGQFTSSTSGNGVTVDPTKSVGGQAAFRHVYHPWMGFEASYGYTRYTDNYSSNVFGVQHNVHEFAGSYLVSAPGLLGIKPFGLAGVSALLFSPSLNGGQRASAQAKPALNFGLGVNAPVLTSHFGVRVQYRALYYPTPDYDDVRYKTGTWRLTSEPMVGLYLKF